MEKARRRALKWSGGLGEGRLELAAFYATRRPLLQCDAPTISRLSLRRVDLFRNISACPDWKHL
jgi:hypothetical protein